MQGAGRKQVKSSRVISCMLFWTQRSMVITRKKDLYAEHIEIAT